MKSSSPMVNELLLKSEASSSGHWEKAALAGRWRLLQEGVSRGRGRDAGSAALLERRRAARTERPGHTHLSQTATCGKTDPIL